MGDHLVMKMDQFPKTDGIGSGTSSLSVVKDDNVVVVESDEEAPLIDMGECRICQEEDSLNNLESPCACNGSLKYAHRNCVQYWCNEKGNITCEICHQQYQPGYIAPPRPPPGEATIDIGGIWQISGTPLDVHDPRVRAMTEAERQFFEADFDHYHGRDHTGAAFCRSAGLILVALLLLRHSLSIPDDGTGDADGGDIDDATTFFSLFLLRVVGFLMPCYIMIWAISILQRRRQRQEAAALATAQFAIAVQTAHNRGLLIAATASPPVASPGTPLHHAADHHQENSLV